MEIASVAKAPKIRGRANGIDVLRAVCALWVIVDHTMYWLPQLQGGDAIPPAVRRVFLAIGHFWQPNAELHPAVLIFIILSGYCVHRAGFRTDSDDLRPFMIRRAYRILPVYLAALAAGIIAITIAFGVWPDRAAKLLIPIDTACLASKVFLIAAIAGSQACMFQVNGPLGTVMVEIVLYAIYALAFGALIWRGKERILWILCALSLVATFGVAAAKPLQPGLYYWWQNSSVYGFLPYWWLGAAVVNPNVARLLSRRIPSVLGVALWVALSVIILVTDAAPLLSEVRKLLFALLVAGLLPVIDRVPLRDNPISAAGRSGYSIYAFHAPIIWVAALAWASWWAVICIAVAGGIVINHLYEDPFRKLGRRIAGRLGGVPLGFDAAQDSRSL